MSLAHTQSRVFPRLSLWTGTCYASRTMSLRTLSAALCFALLALAPLSALAQIPQTGLSVTLAGEERDPTQLPVYVNASECTKSFTFKVTFPVGPTGAATA